MNKIQEQCYLAGYNGKKRPPWVANYMKGLVNAYNEGVKDRKNGNPIQYNNNLNYLTVTEEKEQLKKEIENEITRIDQ